MRISVAVASPTSEHCFKARVCFSCKQDGLYLSPTEFYGRYGTVPVGENYELQIEKPEGEGLKGLHVHLSEKTGKPFVCYPLPIPNLERAQELFCIWCLGAVMALKRVDLNIVFSQEFGDEAKFRRVVQESYGIHIARSILAP